MSRVLSIATAQYPIGRPADFSTYAETLTAWVGEAAHRIDGPGLLVFPEYGAMELASTFGAATEGDLEGQIAAVSGLVERIDALHAALAARHGLHILAASLPVRLADGRAVNRARFFAPNGEIGVQDKQIMTRFERESWGISGNPGLRLFETPIGRIGIAICYDVEFPLIGRAFGEAGAEVVLAPSCTDTLAGANRVRTGALARALENQYVVVVSATVGEAPWSPSVDVNRGRAGIYAPSDAAISETGILTEGRLDAAGWVHGSVDLDLIARARTDGEVLSFHHWGEQPGAATLALPAVEHIRLGFEERSPC